MKNNLPRLLSPDLSMQDSSMTKSIGKKRIANQEGIDWVRAIKFSQCRPETEAELSALQKDL